MIIILAGGGANHYISWPIISTTFFYPYPVAIVTAPFQTEKERNKVVCPNLQSQSLAGLAGF